MTICHQPGKQSNSDLIAILLLADLHEAFDVSKHVFNADHFRTEFKVNLHLMDPLESPNHLQAPYVERD